MSLVPSLLQAIVQANGEAMVMHAGEKPYVVAPTGQIELASRALTLEAVTGIVAQLLPADYQRALEEFDAVQYELPPQPEFPRENFTVVVARGGDDVWTEIRRRQVPDEDRIPEEFFGAPPPHVASAEQPQYVEEDAVILDEISELPTQLSTEFPTQAGRKPAVESALQM